MHNIPDLITELRSGCRSDTDTEERGNDETHRQSDNLWPHSGTGGLGAGSEIRRVGDYLISVERLRGCMNVLRVNMLLKQDEMEINICQVRALPLRADG